jgi:hypothetical protein
MKLFRERQDIRQEVIDNFLKKYPIEDLDTRNLCILIYKGSKKHSGISLEKYKPELVKHLQSKPESEFLPILQGINVTCATIIDKLLSKS